MRVRLLAGPLAFFVLAATAHPERLSMLSGRPEWRLLDRYQDTLTVDEFRSRLWLYSPDGSIYQYLGFENGAVQIYDTPDKQNKLWELHFAETPPPDASVPEKPPALRIMSGATLEKPLIGLRICLDPGHIGGAWSDIEERKMRIGSAPPVEEASLNFTTCHWVEKELLEAGAEVVWSRQLGEPATPLRPEDLRAEGIQMMWDREPKKAQRLGPSGQVKLAQWYAELLFYRVAEIHARAAIVAQLKPDLTLCLHYNAGPPGRRGTRLYNANKIIIFVHGSYMPSELEFDDMKFDLFSKLLEGSAPVEREVATCIARQVKEVWGFRPEDYQDGKEGAHRINDNPYVFSRNLLASRLFPGPTVFIEGPYMNDRQMYARIQAGDYEGEKEINGKKVRSIFREYGEIAARGIIDYYRKSLETETAEK